LGFANGGCWPGPAWFWGIPTPPGHDINKLCRIRYLAFCLCQTGVPSLRASICGSPSHRNWERPRSKGRSAPEAERHAIDCHGEAWYSATGRRFEAFPSCCVTGRRREGVPATTVPPSRPQSAQATGAIYGGQISYNCQHGWSLFGIEANWPGANVQGNTPCVAVLDCRRDINSIGRVESRRSDGHASSGCKRKTDQLNDKTAQKKPGWHEPLPPFASVARLPALVGVSANRKRIAVLASQGVHINACQLVRPECQRQRRSPTAAILAAASSVHGGWLKTPVLMRTAERELTTRVAFAEPGQKQARSRPETGQKRARNGPETGQIRTRVGSKCTIKSRQITRAMRAANLIRLTQPLSQRLRRGFASSP